MAPRTRIVDGWWLPALYGLTAATILLTAAIAMYGVLHPGSPPHYGLLADALRHGRLDIAQRLYDDTFWNGRAYIPMGPLPAALMIPAVVVFGTSFPTTCLSAVMLVFGAVALMATWRTLSITSWEDRVCLTLLTLGGTTYLSSLVVNSSYFSEHIVVFACLSGALLLALRRRLPWMAGALVGLAALTRAPDALAIAPIALLYASRGDQWAWRTALSVALGALPFLLLLALYNAARFGNPLDGGYAAQTLSVNPLIAARSVGLFSLSHLPKNLYYLLVAAPQPFDGEMTPVMRFPWLTPSDWGTGILWISPWLLAGIFARGRQAAILAAGAALVLFPALTFYSTGWVQFGSRYAIDAFPFLAVLAVIAVKQRGWQRWVAPLTAYSVLANVAGAYWLVHRLGG
jgi:hypothetical protein